MVKIYSQEWLERNQSRRERCMRGGWACRRRTPSRRRSSETRSCRRHVSLRAAFSLSRIGDSERGMAEMELGLRRGLQFKKYMRAMNEARVL